VHTPTAERPSIAQRGSGMPVPAWCAAVALYRIKFQFMFK
jgi:hypothetical protein